ncbi:MAG: FAD-binding oxidoreductase [Desulfobacteraceae bacterium]|nr:FAD-binding oxidoreductase [Desulfobacteraceae bacterium]
MKLTGWGRYPRIDACCYSFESGKYLQKCLEKKGTFISYGLGRSYGDSALNNQVILTRRFNKILDFNEESGIVTCESGVSLAGLISAFLSRGWFLSVTPGTKFVTIGGAIASDVHGKNHHKAGCFSSCVKSLELMLPDGNIVQCSKEKNRELFLSTCGGMGLTGVIVSAEIQLRKTESAYIDQKIVKARNLEEIFKYFEQYADWTYSVAWIDCLAKGNDLGRSILMIGEHADDGFLHLPRNKKLSVPLEFPGFALNKHTVSLFNWLYFNKVRKNIIDNQTTIDSFFYPLDAVHNWNRIYGKNGFTQYQLVLPKEKSFEGLSRILNKISESGLGSFLAVLKLFGPENDNYLSFPLEGYTLALDFKIEPRLFPLLDALDNIVLEYGGRIYLSKDVRLSQEVIEQGYPRINNFRAVRKQYGLENKLRSRQSVRLGI